MGREVMRTIASADDVELAGVWLRRGGILEPEQHPAATASDNLEEVLRSADVAIDFSLPGATSQILDTAEKLATPLVCGVSGLDESTNLLMQRAASAIPLLYDRNMSLGIAVLKDLVGRAAARLGESFAAEIRETHHAHKKDAPSGTALVLGEVLARSRNQNFADVMRYEPGGRAGRRAASDIVFRVTRQGEVPGEHTVEFRSDDESLELRHSVTDRRVFATGALQAARWLVRQKPGLYRMSDFLANNTA